MADIYDTLHPVNTPADNLYPNIKPEQNIPDASISKQKLNFSVGGQGAAAILPGEEYVDIAYNGNPGSVLFPKGTHFIYTRDGWLNNTPPYTGTYNTVSEDFNVMAYWYDVSENLIKSSEAVPSDDGIILSIPEDDFLVMVLIKNPNENGPRVIPVYSIIPTSLIKYNTRDYDWAALQVTGFTINDGEYPQLGSGYLVDQFSTPVVAANTNYYKICNMKILSADIGRDVVSASAIVWIAATSGSAINTAFVSLNLVMDTLTHDYSASGATIVGGAFDAGKLVYTIEFDADKSELTITLYAALSKDAMLAAGNVCYVRYRDAQGDRQSTVPVFYGTDTGSASAPFNSIPVKQIGTAFNPEGAYPNLGAGKDGDGNVISETYAKKSEVGGGMSLPSIKPPLQSYWKTKTFNGITGSTFTGTNVWTDGDNIYYSEGTRHLLLDKATSTWTAKTWSGLTSFIGQNVWTDGENIYNSNGTSVFVLDKATSTWEEKTWGGLTYVNSENIWTDGYNIYYSFLTSQYILDKSTSTWEEKTWSGLTGFYGEHVWTDGDNIYYSSETDQYVLDKATSTWEEKTWGGLTSFDGEHVWTDGDNIYYSSETDQYVLDKATSTWEEKTWSGLTNFTAIGIWTDGENVYYSRTPITHRQLMKPIATPPVIGAKYGAVKTSESGGGASTRIFYSTNDLIGLNLGATRYVGINYNAFPNDPPKKGDYVKDQYGVFAVLKEDYDIATDMAQVAVVATVSAGAGGTAYHHHIHAELRSAQPEPTAHYNTTADAYFEIVTDSADPITSSADLYDALMGLAWTTTETRWTPATGGLWVDEIPDDPDMYPSAWPVVGIRALAQYQPDDPSIDSRSIEVMVYRVGKTRPEGPLQQVPFYYSGFASRPSHIYDTVTDQYGNYIAGGD